MTSHEGGAAEEVPMEHGQVDVVVLAAGEPRFDRSVLTELERLPADGPIRVLDATVLLDDDGGLAYALDMEDLPAEEKTALGFIETGTEGLFDSYDADLLIEAWSLVQPETCQD
jgi:hypothetical protein